MAADKQPDKERAAEQCREYAGGHAASTQIQGLSGNVSTYHDEHAAQRCAER